MISRLLPYPARFARISGTLYRQTLGPRSHLAEVEPNSPWDHAYVPSGRMIFVDDPRHPDHGTLERPLPCTMADV